MARGRKADDSDDPLSRQVSYACLAQSCDARLHRDSLSRSLVGVQQSLKAAVWYTVTKVSLFRLQVTQKEHAADDLCVQIAQEEGMHGRRLVRNTVQKLISPPIRTRQSSLCPSPHRNTLSPHWQRSSSSKRVSRKRCRITSSRPDAVVPLRLCSIARKGYRELCKVRDSGSLHPRSRF